MTDTPPTTLTADAILSRQAVEDFIEVPELGGWIKCRQYMTGDHMWVAEKLGESDDPTGLGDLLWTFIRCSVEPSFDESQYETLKGKIPTSTLMEIAAKIGRIGGEAATVKAAEKSPVAE